MMMRTKVALPLAAFIVALAFAVTPADAKSSSTSHSSSRSSSSHASAGTTKKPLPAGAHFVRKTCKTASCKAKHPGGSYMLPIKPKKGAA
jgi:hypothetical protein